MRRQMRRALKSVLCVKSHIHNKIVKLFRNGIKSDKLFTSTTQINAVGRPRRNPKTNCHHAATSYDDPSERFFLIRLLHVPIYARLRIFIQLSATLTKLCHIKCDHPVHIMCAICPPSAEMHAGIFCHFSQTVRNFLSKFYTPIKRS